VSWAWVLLQPRDSLAWLRGRGASALRVPSLPDPPRPHALRLTVVLTPMLLLCSQVASGSSIASTNQSMAPKANTFVTQAVELVRCAARISRSHRSKCLTLPFSPVRRSSLLAIHLGRHMRPCRSFTQAAKCMYKIYASGHASSRPR
jgi:hypothetical protein